MAEVRKHEPDAGDGLGRLVREALGESIRPTQQGQRSPGRDQDESTHPDAAPHEPRAGSLPEWSSDGPAFTF
ncbi:hypothetical protein [Tessaracoccus sp.]